MTFYILFVLYSICFLFLITRQNSESLKFYLPLIIVTPIFQYYIGSYVGDNYFLVEPKRYIFEYSNLALLIIFLFKERRINKNAFFLVLLLLVIGLASVGKSIHVYKSFVFFPIGVLTGLVAFLFFSSFKFGYWKTVNTTFKNFLLTNLVLGFSFISYSIITSGSLDFNDRLKGLYSLSNIGMILMLPFYAYLSFEYFLGKAKRLDWKYISISIGILLGMLSSISRTAILLYGLIFIIIIFKQDLKKSTLLIINGSVLVVLILFVTGFEIDLILNRFTGEGNSTRSFSSDLRILMWAGIFMSTSESSVSDLLLGNGLLSFKEADFNILEFSNAHSFILNSLYEQGLIYILLLLTLTAVILFKQNIGSKQVTYLKYSLILYFISLCVNNDLFMASGQHSALPGFIYFLFLGLINNRSKRK